MDDLKEFGDEICDSISCSDQFPHRHLKEVYGGTPARNTVSGRPMTVTNRENIAEIESLIRSDRRITTRDITDELELSLERIHHIVREELSFRNCRTAWVPKNLTTAQLQKRVDGCTFNLEIIKCNKHFLDTVITFDETWVYYEDHAQIDKESRDTKEAVLK